jgi:periplasmic divalent cation tolerance protein
MTTTIVKTSEAAVDAVIVLTTWPADGDPAALAETLVRERLAACVNLLPEMESVYSWKGNIEHDRERQVIVKTTAARLDDLAARIASLHPYEVPELLVVKVDAGGKGYLKWMGDLVVGR